MVGKNYGLIALCEKYVNFPNFKSHHYVIHQQNMSGNVLKYYHVINVVVKAVSEVCGEC